MHVRAHWELPLREASGLAIRCRTADRPVQLLAVDDERFQLAVAALAGAVEPAGGPVDVAGIVPDADDRHGSDFEAVASDASGRVFVLQERAGRVLVFDARLRAVEQVITLSVPPAQPEVGPEWHRHHNARGEGLLLMRGGHLLVAKQRRQPRLIEFGPPGDEPRGFAPGDSLGADEAFSLDADAEATFGVLASWLVDPGSGVESINDLTIDARGRLHAVSATSRRLARLGQLEPLGGTAALTSWPLPEELFGDHGKAEGLAWAPGLGWLVSLDLGRHGRNLFQIDGVPA